MIDRTGKKEQGTLSKDTRQIFQLVLVMIIGITLTWSASLQSFKLARNDAERDLARDATAVADSVWNRFSAKIEAANDLAAFAVAYGANGIPDKSPEVIQRFRRYINANTSFSKQQQFIALATINDQSVELEQWYHRLPEMRTETDQKHMRALANDTAFMDAIKSSVRQSQPIFIVPPEQQLREMKLPAVVITAYPFSSTDDSRNVILLATDFSSLTEGLNPNQWLGGAVVQVSLAGLGDDAVQPLIATDFSSGRHGVSVSEIGSPVTGHMVHSSQQVLGQQTWRIDIWPPKGAYRIDYSRPMVTGVVVVMLTALVCFIIYNQSERAGRVIEIVNRRTKALKEAHQELEGNYHLLKSLNTDLDKARRTAEIANASKSEFIATISHELRTPLNAVLGFSQLLRDQALGPIGDKRYLDYAGDIHESGAYLLQLINDILDLAKLEAGKLELVSGNVSVARLQDRVKSIISPTAMQKDLDITLESADNVPESFKGDELRLRQVLLNLGSNAVKFTRAGSVRFYFEAISKNDDDRLWLRVSVFDTGVGIPETKLANLFDRFTQVDNSRTRAHNGAGLGLSICRELVTMMDGEILVESVVDEGSCFKVEIPIVPSDDEDAEDDLGFI